MKLLILLLIALPRASFALCPIELNIEGETYCTKIEWLKGEKKVQGQFQVTSQLSPHLVPLGEIPQKWIYSRAEFVFWKKGDTKHSPQFIKNLRIFPYMHMKNGHHHSTSYDYVWTETTLQLDSVVFQEMPGCWSLRWTTANDDALKSSELLMTLANYNNLSDEGNSKISNLCIGGI